MFFVPPESKLVTVRVLWMPITVSNDSLCDHFEKYGQDAFIGNEVTKPVGLGYHVASPTRRMQMLFTGDQLSVLSYMLNFKNRKCLVVVQGREQLCIA